MKTKTLLFATLSLVAAGALSAAASAPPSSQVDVTFVQPEKFTDAKTEAYDSDRGREQILGEIKSYVEKRAGHYLTAGQHLTVRITDIDLAGDFEPWHGPNFDDIRILKEIYPPRMTIEYRLTGADGKVISEGKRDLQNLGYLMSNAFPSSDGLRYDKEMLSDWMRRDLRRPS
ncbi:MAG: DUF3016 domain-containing protein [Opitutae bacterium]|nr:DUF3016 domain-containing protein [Opitutae bacterium]